MGPMVQRAMLFSCAHRYMGDRRKITAILMADTCRPCAYDFAPDSSNLDHITAAMSKEVASMRIAGF